MLDAGWNLGTYKASKEWQCRTLCCKDCNECYLVSEINQKQNVVHLRLFLQRRGVGKDRRALDDMSLARNLWFDLVCNKGDLSFEQQIDFGIETPVHYAALQFAGLDEYMLDRVQGDGKAITNLVRAATDDQLVIEFKTPWDGVIEREEANREGQQ